MYSAWVFLSRTTKLFLNQVDEHVYSIYVKKGEEVQYCQEQRDWEFSLSLSFWTIRPLLLPLYPHRSILSRTYNSRSHSMVRHRKKNHTTVHTTFGPLAQIAIGLMCGHHILTQLVPKQVRCRGRQFRTGSKWGTGWIRDGILRSYSHFLAHHISWGSLDLYHRSIDLYHRPWHRSKEIH